MSHRMNGGLFNDKLHRNCVGSLEADVADVPGRSMRVLGHHAKWRQTRRFLEDQCKPALPAGPAAAVAISLLPPRALA